MHMFHFPLLTFCIEFNIVTMRNGHKNTFLEKCALFGIQFSDYSEGKPVYIITEHGSLSSIDLSIVKVSLLYHN